MICFVQGYIFRGINIGVLKLFRWASCSASGQSDLHGGLLGVRERLF